MGQGSGVGHGDWVGQLCVVNSVVNSGVGQGGQVPGAPVVTVIVVHGWQVGQGSGVGQLWVVISAVVIVVVVAVVVETNKICRKNFSNYKSNFLYK